MRLLVHLSSEGSSLSCYTSKRSLGLSTKIAHHGLSLSAESLGLLAEVRSCLRIGSLCSEIGSGGGSLLGQVCACLDGRIGCRLGLIEIGSSWKKALFAGVKLHNASLIIGGDGWWQSSVSHALYRLELIQEDSHMLFRFELRSSACASLQTKDGEEEGREG